MLRLSEIYTLSLHDALPIFVVGRIIPISVWEDFKSNIIANQVICDSWDLDVFVTTDQVVTEGATTPQRSEEHTSELQSLRHLVCRLLLEKKTKYIAKPIHTN